MRTRSNGPLITSIMVPQGSASVGVYYSQSFAINMVSGGTLLGVPYTIGVDIIVQDGGWRPARAFRVAVAQAWFAAHRAQVPVTPMVSANVTYEYESMSDVVTERYKARIAAGEIINNPMDQVFSAYRTDPVPVTKFATTAVAGVNELWDCYRYRNDPTGSLTLSVTHYWTSTSTVYTLTAHDVIVKDLIARVSSPADSAIMGAFQKLQDAELDVALMAAEGKETISYLRLQVMRAAKLCRAISDPKKVFKYAPKAFKSIGSVGLAKALANAWLEARYALRPLLIDIDNTIQYLSGGMTKQKQNRYTYRKNESNTSSGTVDVMVGVQKITVNYSAEKSARAGVLAQAGISVPGHNFGFMNWANIAFEKVKFSFILAWLIDFGGILYRLNPNVSLTPLASWVTEIQSVSYVATMVVATPDGNKTITSSGSYRRKLRNPIVDNKPPLITFAVNLDSFKLLDLLAIVGQIKTR